MDNYSNEIHLLISEKDVLEKTIVYTKKALIPCSGGRNHRKYKILYKKLMLSMNRLHAVKMSLKTLSVLG